MFNSSNVVVGDSAVFQLKVTVPSGWADLTTVLTGVTGMNQLLLPKI